MKTGDQWLADLKKRKATIYNLGKKVEDITMDTTLRPVIRAAKQTYDINFDPDFMELATVESPLIGERVTRFAHPLLSQADLVNRVEFNRAWARSFGCCNLRCQACACVNVMHSITYDIDQRYGTDYHQRFIDFLKYLQENDLMLSANVMDVKGNRVLRPSQQEDPDLYLRVVERRPDGVVVRGAKAHQTAAAICAENFVIPCRAMTRDDKDYAIAFTIPTGTPGIIHIMQHSFQDSRALVAEDIDFGNTEYASAFSGTSLMIFDDVFVPKERIFMDGEYEFTGTLIRRFGSLARMWEGGCRPGLFDLLLGASACITEYNGIEEAPHVIDKLSHLALLAETSFSSAIASTMYPERSASGIHFPDIRLVSVSKFHTINGMYDACKLANDLAGGLTITMPSEKDYKNPETHKYMEKYLQGKAGVPTEHRIRMFRFIESITSGSDACGLHYGGATLQPQLFNLWRHTNFDELKKRVRILSGVEKSE